MSSTAPRRWPRWRRILLGFAAVVLVAAGAGWTWQSELIGFGTRLYLRRIAASEEQSGDLTQRRAAVARVHRMLLMPPPADALVPELFDMLGALSPRVSTGEINLEWAAYVFTSYMRDLTRDRPHGHPRRSSAEIDSAVAQYVEFFRLQKRPDANPIEIGDLAGQGDAESYTVEEIEKAEREGRDVTKK